MPSRIQVLTPTEPLIAAGLERRLLLPSDPEYDTLQASYWSKCARLAPAAILRPQSAIEVCPALEALIAADQKFAIRSGGHSQWAGANNVDGGGVTIDLGLLNWTRFDEATETVDIGPGARWKEVYQALREHRRTVAGGRDGNVGVGGFLLGGGKTFFAAERGFACDDVVSFEVVLAGGGGGLDGNASDGSEHAECRVVTATAEQHQDLFFALKGGSNNFGIVTNFRMRAIPSESVWAGLNFFPKQMKAEATQALVAYTNDVYEHPDSHLLFFLTYMVSFQYINWPGKEDSP